MHGLSSMVERRGEERREERREERGVDASCAFRVCAHRLKKGGPRTCLGMGIMDHLTAVRLAYLRTAYLRAA